MAVEVDFRAHRAALGELHGVGEQVVEDLAHTRRVGAPDAPRRLRHLNVQADVLVRGEGGEHVARLTGCLLHV